MCVLQVLCCVDKQGILSWASPNPEKILFFCKSSLSHETDKQRQNEIKREKELEEFGLKDPMQVTPKTMGTYTILSTCTFNVNKISLNYDFT